MKNKFKKMFNVFKNSWNQLKDKYESSKQKYLDDKSLAEDDPIFDFMSEISDVIDETDNDITRELTNIEKYWENYQNEIQNNVKNTGFKYANWELLFNDAWNETFSKKEEFYDERFVKDLETKVFKNSELSNEEKVSITEALLYDWEDIFHDLRFQMISKVVDKAIDIAGQENLRYLTNNKDDLDWFYIKTTNDGLIEINLSHYDVPFQFEFLKEFLTYPDNPEFLELKSDSNSPIRKFGQKLEVKNYLEDASHLKDYLETDDGAQVKRFDGVFSWSDDRWFMIGSTTDYDELKDEWNDSIDKTIKEVKDMYQENKHLLSESNSL